MRLLPAAGVALAFWLIVHDAGAQPSVSSLVEKLESTNKRARLQAVSELGNRGKGARSMTPALVAHIDKEKDPQIQLQAVKALAQIGAHADLQALLEHADNGVRKQAIWGLGAIGPDAKRAVPELTKLLKDRDSTVRGLAAQSLGEIGLQSQEDARELLTLLSDAHPEVRLRAQHVLMSAGAVSIPALESMLGEREPAWVRIAILQILACQGPEAKPAAPTLTQMLKDGDPIIRLNTVGALTAIGSAAKESLPALFETLLDKNPQVQAAAFHAVLTIGMEDRQAVSEHLRRTNARGRWAQAQAVPVPVLIQKLKDGDANVRLAAAFALGQRGKEAESAIGALKGLANDADPQVRNGAQAALARLDQKNREDYLRRTQMEQAKLMRETQQQLAKLQSEQAKIFRESSAGLFKAQKEQFEALQQLRLLPQTFRADVVKFNLDIQRYANTMPKGPSNVPLVVATHDQARQKYIQQLVQMHIAISQSPVEKAAEDWVREQILQLGTEAVPALAQGFKLGIDYRLGFV